MPITATKLRQNIFSILDAVIETGQSVTIERKGEIIKLVPVKKKSKLSNLKKRHFSDEPLENFSHLDWSAEWTEGKS